MSSDELGTTFHLLHAARTGNSASFDRIFTRVGPGVLRFIRNHLDGSRLSAFVDAEDVLHETYLRILRKGSLETFEHRGKGSLAGWLCAIARNCLSDLADHYGAQKRRPPQGTTNSSRVIAGIVASDQRSPSSEAAVTEKTLKLRLAMQSLTPEGREILSLRNDVGLTLEEIAVVVGLSVATVKRRISSSMEALGAALIDSEPPEEGLPPVL
ncbi:MAG: sigma-70 family RNA polymerase sigma factor [Planctomycetes bacterium]|nr:sigma-70 family RNA polymerase sigma factor [Planctomycetota bacterium]